MKSFIAQIKHHFLGDKSKYTIKKNNFCTCGLLCNNLISMVIYCFSDVVGIRVAIILRINVREFLLVGVI